MANLITEQQKKIIAREYSIRLTATIFVVLTLLGVFLLSYIIPYYFLMVKNDQIVSPQFQSVIDIENKENVGESVSKIVTRTLDELKSVETYNKEDTIIPSLGFEKIIKHKNPSIRITRLSFNLIKAGEGQFLINGIASNRDGLVSFVDDLKSETDFATVESPISDLAKSTGIAFTVNIKIKL